MFVKNIYLFVDTYLYVFTCLKLAVRDKWDHRLLIFLLTVFSDLSIISRMRNLQ